MLNPPKEIAEMIQFDKDSSNGLLNHLGMLEKLVKVLRIWP